MSNLKILGLSCLALFLALLTLPTAFLLLPVLLLPALSCLISILVYRRGLRGQKRPPGLKIIALLPIPVALTIFWVCFQWISTGYRA